MNTCNDRNPNFQQITCLLPPNHQGRHEHANDNWTHLWTDANPCPCCLGDPDTVCDACGSHACWAGRYMCGDSQGAGTRPWREGDPVEPVSERSR